MSLENRRICHLEHSNHRTFSSMARRLQSSTSSLTRDLSSTLPIVWTRVAQPFAIAGRITFNYMKYGRQ